MPNIWKQSVQITDLKNDWIAQAEKFVKPKNVNKSAMLGPI